jgi:hypothetical protein
MPFGLNLNPSEPQIFQIKWPDIQGRGAPLAIGCRKDPTRARADDGTDASSSDDDDGDPPPERRLAPDDGMPCPLERSVACAIAVIGMG